MPNGAKHMAGVRAKRQRAGKSQATPPTEALRLSEERVRVAAMAAEIGIWYWTPGTDYVEVTANWRRLFGVPPDAQVTFETWRDALHPEDRDRAVRELNAASDEHREFNIEYRALNPDGTIRWIVDRGRASYGDDGKPVSMAGVNVDITERKLAEEKLADAHQRNKAILESISDGFNAFDHEWRYTYVNAAGARMVGKTPEELLGRNVWELWPQAENSPFGIAYHKAMDERVQLGVEAFYGEPLNRWYNVRCYPSAEGLTLFFTDVTERKKADEALRRIAQFPEENPNPVLRVGDDGTLLYANPPARAFLGVVPPTDNQPLPVDVQDLVAEAMRRSKQVERELTAQNGRVFWFTALRPQDEQYVNLYGSDITDRKRAEAIIRELSTPVLPARNGLLVVPMIGALDPQRAKQLTEQLLKSIRQNRAKVVVVDVTGVATIDTSVANHLVQTAEASRLLGAQVILTGISTGVAHTLVALGANLGSLKTLGDLQSGVEEANRLLDVAHREGDNGSVATVRMLSAR